MEGNRLVMFRKKRHKPRLGMLELVIWSFLCVLVAWPAFKGLLIGEEFLFLDHYTSFLIGLFVFILPFMVKLIFGLYPFEYIRWLRYKNMLNQAYETEDEFKHEDKETILFEGNAENELKEIELDITDNKNETILLTYIRQAKGIADKIYTRGGVYLLVGCLIAFAGVLVFYFQSAGVKAVWGSNSGKFVFTKTILDYLPRLGTLIFVEAIAFFFLKQYRITMEEFRYYDAIKRQRENQYAILEIVTNTIYTDAMKEKIIAECAFGDNPDKFDATHTRQILEATKAIQQDPDLIDKIIEVIKVSRK